ncbi:MAG: hypothetical protein IKW62_04780 [Clostridia bacterium]|nr:hypothetical protein [Clostridia bacterium]
MKKIAVIDLGSNSVRMSIFDEKGRTLRSFRSTIRLSEGMTGDLCLKADAQMRAVKVLCEYKTIIDEEGVSLVRAVATAAVRKAKNQKEFLDLVRDAAKIDIRVIDGSQEAALDSLAISRYFDCKKGIICDIGGGSTELIGIQEGKEIPMVSIPYGSRGICEEFFKNGEEEDAVICALNFLDNILKDYSWIDNFKGGTLVGIGGTLRALAKFDLKDFGGNAIEGYEVSLSRMEEIIREIESADIECRSKMAGIGKERADIILGGLVILKAVIKAVRPEKILVADVGVREGVFFDLIENTGIL